jgi:hypothetical protein
MFTFFAEDTDKLEKRLLEDYILKVLETDMLISDQSRRVSETIMERDRISKYIRFHWANTWPVMKHKHWN